MLHFLQGSFKHNIHRGLTAVALETLRHFTQLLGDSSQINFGSGKSCSSTYDLCDLFKAAL
jgi:hypothetical protein